MPRPLAVVCLVVVVPLLAACLVAPWLVWGPRLANAWWIAAAVGGLVAVLNILWWRDPSGEVDAEVPRPPSGDIDFDRPWKGGR